VLRLVLHFWTSASYMTAASIVARAFAFFAPVPFLGALFTDSVVALWFVFVTFQSLIASINGTLPTIFLHMVSYAAAGSTSLGGPGDAHVTEEDGAPNWALLNRICRLTSRIFSALAGVWAVFALTLGTLIVWEPLTRSQIGEMAWLAWGVFVCGASFRILQQGYVAYLLGFGQVTEVRRYEAVSWLASGLGAIITLLIAPSFLAAIVVVQAPLIVNFFVLRHRARKHGWTTAGDRHGDGVVITSEIIPRAWRGSLGVLTSNGAVYGSGLYYAQVGTSSSVAAYLFALSVMGMIGFLAMSPYVSRLPELGRLWAQQKTKAQNQLARDGMVLSMWWFALLVLAAPLGVALANQFRPNSFGFVTLDIWIALVVSSALHRYGALHMQNYTVTNDVKWHIADTVNAGLFMALLWVFFYGDIIVLPLSQAAALLLFYVPYSRYLNRQRFQFYLHQDIPGVVLPVAAAISILALMLFLQGCYRL